MMTDGISNDVIQQLLKLVRIKAHLISTFTKFILDTSSPNGSHLTSATLTSITVSPGTNSLRRSFDFSVHDPTTQQVIAHDPHLSSASVTSVTGAPILSARNPSRSRFQAASSAAGPPDSGAPRGENENDSFSGDRCTNSINARSRRATGWRRRGGAECQEGYRDRSSRQDTVGTLQRW